MSGQPKLEWLVWSIKRGAWHCPNFCGYTSDLSRAGRFTEADARRYHDEPGPEANSRMVHVSEARKDIDREIAKHRQAIAALQLLKRRAA